MTNLDKGEFTLRPFPVAVVAAEDKPCPRTVFEQACEKKYPFYRHAAQEVRHWRREAHEAKERRKTTHNPLKWLTSAGNLLYAKGEGYLAQKRLAVIRNQLDKLAPACPHGQSPPPPQQRFMALAAIAALAITPTSSEFLPLTPDQKLDAALAFAQICGTGSGGGPDKQSLCHAPKLSLRPRQDGKGLDITLA